MLIGVAINWVREFILADLSAGPRGTSYASIAQWSILSWVLMHICVIISLNSSSQITGIEN